MKKLTAAQQKMVDAIRAGRTYHKMNNRTLQALMNADVVVMDWNKLGHVKLVADCPSETREVDGTQVTVTLIALDTYAVSTSTRRYRTASGAFLAAHYDLKPASVELTWCPTCHAYC